jgi:hypothetical protein
MKNRHRLLGALLLALVAATLAKGVEAAAFRGSDYVRIEVPHMGQAVTFFRDVLACQPVAPAASDAAAQASRLMSCGAGSMVELVAAPAPAAATHQDAGPVRLVTDNLAGADRWLQRKGVRVIGAPQKSGGQTVLNFVAPWGLRMQLVSWRTSVATAGP